VLRFPLRAKLALLAMVLLVLPGAGWLYVREMERFLVSAQEQALAATARAVATALHERPRLLVYRARGLADLRAEAEHELRRLAGGVIDSEAAARAEGAGDAADGEIAAILKGLERASSRIWVVNREYRVLALAGSLKQGDLPSPGAVQRLLGWLLSGPTEEFDDAISEDVVAAGREVATALQGVASTRTRNTRDGRVVVISAAHPIWVGSEVHGAVVVEETANRIASLRNQAIERLLTVTLAAFVLVAAVLLWFAARISSRIRRLSDEAEAAIDARGRVTRLATASDAPDEIGDLSRSFTTVLERLARYNAYLETLADRLSHELRTPVAVVRSSLENLHAARGAEDIRTYVGRAEEGLARLGTILSRMTEASRLEQSLSASTRNRFDAAAVVRGCVEGYRLAYAPRRFELDEPAAPAPVDGSADLLAQMLDKLAENAADFAEGDSAVRIVLQVRPDTVVVRVENRGPLLPAAIRDSLFHSMVSQRSAASGGAPHLGLGLYIARLIAEFHGGTLRAENLPEGDGVAVEAALPRAV